MSKSKQGYMYLKPSQEIQMGTTCLQGGVEVSVQQTSYLQHPLRPMQESSPLSTQHNTSKQQKDSLELKWGSRAHAEGTWVGASGEPG